MILSTRPSPIAAPTVDPFTCLDDNGASAAAAKRKRRPAGTPDPDAEVVSLSPRTLMESDRYVCEICNQGFQRDQNLQMHRRRHKVPWKLLKRSVDAGGGGVGPAGTRKRVYVCPEPSCLHHDPCHALGDLVGIKKHFRRKHSSHRQWVCARCSKAYAVQSDFKAHLKTCGTRGHTCDCGRVFSRVESFIEHQDSCNNMERLKSSDSHNNLQTSTTTMVPCRSQTASTPSPASDQTHVLTNNVAPWTPLTLFNPHYNNLDLDHLNNNNNNNNNVVCPNIITESSHNLELQLSLGSSESGPVRNRESSRLDNKVDYAKAVEEKARADEARRESRREVEEAEREFDNARRMRQHAQAELNKAQIMREQARRQAEFAFLQVTCRACKQSYMSSITEGDVERDQ